MQTSTVSFKDWLIIMTFLLVAMISRLWGIHEWPLSGDEYFTYKYANERTFQLINPAYYHLVLISYSIFGINELSARLPAAIIGIISVPIFYATWINVIGRKAAFIACLFIIFSAWHLWLSQFARFYTGVFLFSSLAYYCYYISLIENKKNYLYYSLFFGSIAVLFHFSAILIFISCFIFSIYVVILRKRKDSIFSVEIAKLNIVILIVAAIIVSPWVWNRILSWTRHEQAWGYKSLLSLLQLAKYTQLSLTVAAFFGVLYLIKRENAKGIFFVTSIGVPIAAYMFMAQYMAVKPNYILCVYPLVIGAAAYLCSSCLEDRSKNQIQLYAVTSIIIVGLMPAWISHYTDRQTLDVREVVDYLEKVYKPGDVVISFVKEFDHYSANKFSILQMGGVEFYETIDWKRLKKEFDNTEYNVWIVNHYWRKPFSKSFKTWTTEKGSLVWANISDRYDYPIRGFQVYLLNSNIANIKAEILRAAEE